MANLRSSSAEPARIRAYSEVTAVLTLLALFLVSIVAGLVTAVSGGAALVAFPALLAAGVEPVVANATCATILGGGLLASSFGYRRDFDEIPHSRALILVALIGGALGALLLVETPSSLFQRFVPYLLLTATLLLGFSGRITWLLSRGSGEVPGLGARSQLAALIGLVLALAVYTGYFGAGVGLMFLAGFSLLGFKRFHGMNASRTLLSGCADGTAMVVFILAGVVDWRFAPLMIVGSLGGGYVGASVTRRLSSTLVKWAVVLLGAGFTVWYFLHPA